MAAADISTAMPTLQNGMTLYPSSTSMNGNGHLCQNGQVATEGSSRASPVPAEEALASTSSSADTVSQNGSHGSVQSDAVDTLKAPSAKRIKLAHKLNYRKGLFLAPMVRCGTLPTRLLSLNYGASLVWGPEIVDKAIMDCERKVDEPSSTISFVHPKTGKSVFECHPIEKSRLIFQVGSADPMLAVRAAKVVEKDVSGVDLNCGCPKDFSIKGGMGAALLSDPEKLCSILRALVSELSVPVSAKIRLLAESAPTLSLVRQVCQTGISCLTVHCRTQTMRPREPALLDRLREVVDEATRYGVPVVANGDCWGEGDRDKICELTGVTSIMIARGAEANPSCFSALTRHPPGLLDPASVVIPLYTRLAMTTHNHMQNTKFCINAMDLAASNLAPYPGIKDKRKQMKVAMSQLKSYEGLCELVGVDYTEASRVLTVEEVLPGLKERLDKEDREVEVDTREDIAENGEDGHDDAERRRKRPAALAS